MTDAELKAQVISDLAQGVGGIVVGAILLIIIMVIFDRLK